MIKKSLLRTFPKLTEKHVKIYGYILFFIGMLYLQYAFMLVICYLNPFKTALAGLCMAWLGSTLSKKEPK